VLMAFERGMNPLREGRREMRNGVQKSFLKKGGRSELLTAY
jgi:hypothetical protein